MKFILCWILISWLRENHAEEGFKPLVNPLVGDPRANFSLRRSLVFDDDIAAREANFYQYPLSPPPPVYGPPVYRPPEYPDQPEGHVEIEFLFNELTIECVVDNPLEHIIWTRFPCPNQIYYGEGIHVADGAMVYNDDLYDVQIRGFNGLYFSELTIRDPIGTESSGLYRCEAWPHFHQNGNGYPPYGAYPPYYGPVESDVFIIGGNSLLENCYGNSPYGPYGNKVNQAITNKKPLISDTDKVSKIKESLKMRRNNTKHLINRKDSNAKYLRYNIKFNNDPISNNANRNTTFKGLVPRSIPFQTRRSDVIIEPPKGPVSPWLVGNATSSIRFDFLGNGNNNTWQLKPRRQYEKANNLTIESFARKFIFPRNQTEPNKIQL